MTKKEQKMKELMEISAQLVSYTKRKIQTQKEFAEMNILWTQFVQACNEAYEAGAVLSDIVEKCGIETSEEEKNNAFTNISNLIKNGTPSQELN